MVTTVLPVVVEGLDITFEIFPLKSSANAVVMAPSSIAKEMMDFIFILLRLSFCVQVVLLSVARVVQD